MTPEELGQLIRGGEDSSVEFRRETVANHDLAEGARRIPESPRWHGAARGRRRRRIVGVQRERLEDWVAELCRAKLEPQVLPSLAWVRDAEPGKHVLAVSVTTAPDKPYARVHNNCKTYYVRVGGTSREASREELERMYQASGRLNYGLKPVPGADVGVLDRRRLRDYLTRVLGGTAPEDDDVHTWATLLDNLELAIDSPAGKVATIDGMLLFGEDPKRFVPQSGIRAICYPTSEPDYATRADRTLRGALTP